MGLKSVLSKPLASFIHKKNQSWINNPIKYQEEVFTGLMRGILKTKFGKDHGLSGSVSIQDFQSAVPVRDYEGLRPWVDQMVEGKENILWEGKPIYYAKTSGTTSGAKYIPITKDSILNHINSARDALLNYVHETGKSTFFDKNMIFLSGSPVLEDKNGVNLGRLSGIVNHHVPQVLRKNQLPTYETNCIEDWEQKLDAVINETLDARMSLISGIPPWVQMYFDRIEEKTGKKIKDVFPEFELFVYGGVNFEPYRQKMYDSIGKVIPSIETYPASEGFIAYQNSQEEEGLLMLLNSGIFYEFIKADEFYNENAKRLTIADVEIGVNYAVIMSSNAGLWGYSIGDTVKFISLNPVKILVTGRIKHFISAFGEHVIGEEVEKAMKATCEVFKEVEIVEFSVAPSINPEKGSSRHEWYVAFKNEPENLNEFEKHLDREMVQLNVYYNDLISGNILQKLKVIPLRENAFIEYMKANGKLGGQNKVPRLSNDRKIADQLMNHKR